MPPIFRKEYFNLHIKLTNKRKDSSVSHKKKHQPVEKLRRGVNMKFLIPQPNKKNSLKTNKNRQTRLKLSPITKDWCFIIQTPIQNETKNQKTQLCQTSPNFNLTLLLQHHAEITETNNPLAGREEKIKTTHRLHYKWYSK